MGIGEKIKELRTASGMSQQAFADVLHVSRDLVSKWECGTRRPDYQAIKKIGEVFNVSADVIIDKKSFIFSLLCFYGCFLFIFQGIILIHHLIRKTYSMVFYSQIIYKVGLFMVSIKNIRTLIELILFAVDI